MATLTWALLALMIALQLGDCVTTWMALRMPGHREGNPFMRALFGVVGVLPGLAIKFAAMVALGLWLFTFTDLTAPIALGVIDALTAWVVWNNVHRIRT